MVAVIKVVAAVRQPVPAAVLTALVALVAAPAEQEALEVALVVPVEAQVVPAALAEAQVAQVAQVELAAPEELAVPPLP